MPLELQPDPLTNDVQTTSLLCFGLEIAKQTMKMTKNPTSEMATDIELANSMTWTNALTTNIMDPICSLHQKDVVGEKEEVEELEDQKDVPCLRLIRGNPKDNKSGE